MQFDIIVDHLVESIIAEERGDHAGAVATEVEDMDRARIISASTGQSVPMILAAARDAAEERIEEEGLLDDLDD